MLKRGEGNYLGFKNRERYFLASILGLITIVVMGIFAYASDEALPSYAFENPIANPGHARVIEVGSAITLDGTGSISPAGAALSYNWTLIRKPDGSLAELNNANTPRPDLLPDIDGDYRVELIVADVNGKSSPAQTVLLSTRNIPPVAMGGADRVARLGQSVRFDPQGTYDANGDRLTAEWSILSYLPFDSLLSDEPNELEEATTINLLCPVNTLESQGVFHAVSATSGQQSPQLAVGVPLAEGTVETGNLSATTYFGPVTMDLTGNASVSVPEGEILQIVLSSAWSRSARAEILISTDGETYTSLGTVGEGGSVYGAYDSNVLRYDDFTVPAGGARFLQVLQQKGGVRVDGVIYETQCQSDAQGPNVPDVDNFSDAATLLEDEDGRFVFIPKLAGQFEVQLKVDDSDGASSIDIVNVYVAPTDNLAQSPESDPNFNIGPVANAGRSQLITLGQTVTLDGSQSTDINGDLLTYKWSVLSKPAESSSVLENVSGPITSFTPDTGQLYVIQLAVTDTHNKTDYDTVVLSSDFISPVAISGSSIEGADGAINNQTASVEGGMSRSSQGTNFNILYDWSLLGLSAGDGVFDGSSRATTGIDFQSLEDQERLRRQSEATIALLAEYNLIVFEDLDTNVDTWGPALIGGDLLGASGTFGTRIPQGQNIDAVIVGGDITGGPKNINNGGNVQHGGAVSTHVNLNGGGQLINDEDIDITSERSGLINLSTQLASLPSNSIADIPNPNGQNGPAHLNANPDTNGVAIFELLDGNVLFNNDRVQQIEINANGAESIIVNIGGQDIDFNRGNFVGAVGNDDLRRKVIWNFYEATDLYLDRQFNGTILAPRAHLVNRTIVHGTVVANSMLARGPVALPSFTGEGVAVEAEIPETNFALVQLGVTDGLDPSLTSSFSTTVLTTGNLRPVARIAQLGSKVPIIGSEVNFDANQSFDGNNDLLSYHWAIISKPQGSDISLPTVSNPIVSVTPDLVGIYILQLVVNDGELNSWPVTFTLELERVVPVADAGSGQSVFIGQQVILDGSASFHPTGDALNYNWSLTNRPEGSQTTLTDFETANPTFVPDVRGEYVLSLIVNDGVQDSEADSVIITTQNRAPIAVITADTDGFLGNIIRVSGENSIDSDGDALNYSWSLQSPQGSTAILSSSSTAAPVFTADLVGNYILSLTVFDGIENSIPVTTSILITEANAPPVLAPIEDRTVDVGTNVSIQLKGSDVDGDTLTYRVTPFPLPAGASINQQTGLFNFTPQSRTPSFIELNFSVSDGVLLSSQSVTITVQSDDDNLTTSYSGRVIDGVSGEPVQGVSVSSRGSAFAITDMEGRFTLSNLSPGQVEIWIEPSNSQQRFVPIVFNVNLIESVNNQASSDIRLMPATAVETIQANTDVILESDNDFGVRVRIPAESIQENVGARYWRIFVNEIPNRAERTSIGEAVFSTGSGQDPIEFTASSTFRNDFSSAQAFDNNSSTAWAAGPRGGEGDWLAVDFGVGNSMPLNRLTLTAWNNNFAMQQMPTSFSIEYSDDANIWKPLSDFDTSVWAPNETRRFDVQGIAEGDIVSLAALGPEEALSLPPNIVPCQLFVLGPKTLRLNRAIEISVENYDNLSPGTNVDVWSFVDGRFRIIGTGEVDAAGRRISTQVENIVGGAPIAFAPRVHELKLADDQATEYFTNSFLGEGAYRTSHSLPSFGLLGRRETTGLIYNSRSADAVSLISADARFTELARPTTLQTSLEVSGNASDFNDFISVGDAEVINQTAIFSGQGLGAGVYPYRFLSTAQYDCTAVTATLNSTIAVSDESNSPYGAGWMIDGIQRLRVNDTGVSISQPDGSTLQFVPPIESFAEDFSDGFGGWGTINPSVGITFEPTGGNPGGYIEETDILARDLVYWTTPDGLVERLPEFIGGEFSYDLQQNNLTNAILNVEDDVVIETISGDRTLFFDFPNSLMPGTSWTRFRVLFTHDSGWAIRRANGTVDRSPTEAEFAEILGQASVFRFRAEHRSGNDVVGLDNAAFGPQSFDLGNGRRISATFESVNGDFSTLTSNEAGGFERRYPDGTSLTFDARGLQTSMIDRNGNETRYVYDSSDRVSEIIDPEGLTTRFAYIGRNLSSITDPSGRESLFAYDDTGALIRIENPEGEVKTFDYDDNQRLIRETDRRGLTTTHNYGPTGDYSGAELPDGTNVSLGVAKSLGLESLGTIDTPREPLSPDERLNNYIDGRGNEFSMRLNEFGAPIMQTDAIGRVTTYERDMNNLVVATVMPSSVTDSGAIRTELEYDDNGYVIRKIEAVGTPLEREEIYEYEPQFSRLIRSVDADGFEIIMEHDANGNMIRMVDPLRGEEIYTYNSQGLKTSGTDKNGNLTRYSYDSFGRLETITDPSDVTTRLILSPEGNILIEIEAVGTDEERRTTIGYDSLNRKIIETAADGGNTRYVYNGNDDIVSITDPTNIVETRSYDSRDRLEIINDPARGATVMEYDPDNNIIRMTDAIGDTTEFEYDAVNRMLSSVDARGQLRAFAYDLRDNITAITDARANITFVTYDELDRPISRTNPNQETWTFGYDLRDNRVRATKPDGVVISVAYDGLSRMTGLVSTASVNGGAVTRAYSYDPYDNLLAANDTLDGASGAELEYTYDQENRTSSVSTSNLFEAGTLNNVHTISYDALDRRAQMMDSFGGTTAYAYDPVDRLTVITTPQNDNFETNYDLAGRVLGRIAPNVTQMIRQYELATGRLASQVHDSAGLAFNDFDYSYTDRGNISNIDERGEVVRTKAYSYDELERLTEVSAPSNPDQNEAYELDSEGNRLSSQLSDDHQTDPANRLTSDDVYTYIYDLNGNLTAKRAKAGAPSGMPDWDYGYDALDQLITVARNGLPVERYRYDAFGRRSLIETANDNDGSFDRLGIVNDGSDRTIDVVQGILGASQILRRYTHGGNVDEPLQVETFDGAGLFDTRYTYHADHLGSIRFLTDAAGNVVNAYDYDSYGRPVAELEAFEQPFRFTGREWDAASELYHYRARNYDPSTGRFIQEDPICFKSGDLNVYRYVENNPIKYIDPSGLVAAISAGTQNQQAVDPKRIAALTKIACEITRSFTSLASIISGAGTGEFQGIVPGGACIGEAVFTPIVQSRPVIVTRQGVRNPDKDDDDGCDEEWAEAYEQCERVMNNPDAPNVTGGYSSLRECARGLVSERCGGNYYER